MPLKLARHIQPRYVIAITVVMALLMVSSALVELQQSQRELAHLMTEEASSLIEAIAQSGRNTILSNQEIEQLLAERLLNNAHLLARLDSAAVLTSQQLAEIAAANDIFRINIFDHNGTKVLSSYLEHDEHAGLPARHEPQDFLQPVLTGEVTQLVIGLKAARIEAGQRYAVAVQRRRSGGGALVLNLDAAYFLEFRKRIGIGKLLQDLGDNSGVEFIALQDEEGIIAASRNVAELSQIAGDDFMLQAQRSDSVHTRIAAFNGRKVFEVAKPLVVQGEQQGLFRLGLSMDEMLALEARMARRLLILSLVLIAIGAVLLTFILINQNLQTVSLEYQRIKSYTGEILQNLAEAVVTRDRQQVITLFNKSAAQMLEVPAEQAVGKPCTEVFGERHAVLADSLLQPSPVRDRETHYVSAAGGTRALAISTSLTYDERGEVDSATAVIKDLTEQRRLEEQMHRREKLLAMGELASGVAHEIRNPLNAISMIAQRFEKEFVPQAEVAEYRALTAVLKSEVQRVTHIIQQFLRFARPPRLNLSQIALPALLQQIAALFAGQARAKGVRFETAHEPDCDLHIDREQMTQAILNLLQNALEATPPGGRISLSCARSGSNAMIRVEDSGSGIPADRLDKIFNLYYTTKPHGTGMGLAITQQIVQQHQGTIQVHSQVGSGTEFLITIPAERNGQ